MLAAKKLKVKKPKSKPKRQRTFTSSEFSLPEDNRHISLSELFRNDALKRRQPPPVLAAAPVKKNRSQKQLQTTKKRGKSRSRARLDKCETYEVIPYKNSLNSEIVFSNEETKREGSMEESASELAIRVNQQYLIDNNRQLRISIRKEYQKKVDAAVKIQKVFRGFLTRKVLQHCLEKEQRKLHDRLAQIRSESVSEHSSYFADKENLLEPRRKAQPEQQGVFEYSQPNAEESEEESEEERIAYRHHEPIYSHDEISGYLQSSEEEDDFDHDAFENNIIFETNEEYVDSRKSSQQPRNKLSRPGVHAAPVAEETTEQIDQNGESLVKTEKKQERLKSKLEEMDSEIREETLKLHQQHSKSHHSYPFEENGECEATLKEDMRGSSSLQNGDCVSVQKLKEEEVQRWDEIISLVQSQIRRQQIDSAQISNFMQQIMELSLKNKKILEINSRFSSPNKHSLSDHSLPRHDSKGRLKTLRAHRSYLTQDNKEDHTVERTEQAVAAEEKLEKEGRKDLKNLSDRALFFEETQMEQHSNAAANPVSPLSSFDNTGQLKKFLEGNVQDEHIDEMLKLREDLLKKREIEEMRKLNLDLESKCIDQEAFLSRLAAIQGKYSEEKARIDRTKEDISRGYRAALRLTKEAVTDAKKLGYDLPISRSVEGIRYKSPLLLNDIIIDQLAGRRPEDRPRQMPSLLSKYRESEPEPRIHIDLSSDGESSDLQFTDEELRRFRRAQPYDIELAEEIADLGRNVMISEELLRQQQAEEQNQMMKTQHVFREIYEIEESSPPRSSPQVDLLTDWITSCVAWEAAGEFLLRPIFSERLVDKSQLQRPSPVCDKERLQFLALLEQNFPPAEVLNGKLNQKISPLPSELLRCMRIDFSEEDEDDNSYEEIGKYEFIIGQDVCNEAIRAFYQLVEAAAPAVQPAEAELERIGREFEFGEKLMRYLQQREKYVCNRRNHTRELRWEVLNIEIHCIFDAWNEELIFLRSQKAGYSGIGLNELTLSVRDHNWQVTPPQTLALIAQGKRRLIRTLSLSSPALLFPEVVEEEEEELLDQDSKWIFYADQALSYGLELVYLIEEEIFNEMAKDLRKRMLKF